MHESCSSDHAPPLSRQSSRLSVDSHKSPIKMSAAPIRHATAIRFKTRINLPAFCFFVALPLQEAECGTAPDDRNDRTMRRVSGFDT